MNPQPPRPQPAGAPTVAAPSSDAGSSSAETDLEVTPPPGTGGPSDELASTRVMGLGDAATPAPAPRKPAARNVTTLGEFQLFKKIGEGAMGAVYRARQASFGRDVALKVLFPHIANNPKLVERLYREGRAMGQLDHPNVVQAFAVGEDQGHYYVAMEYVEGQSMQKWVGQLGRLSVADALYIILRCARGLAYAHAQGMVHRDVKPDNILITPKGEVKIADLGMVKTHDEDMSLTQTGHAVGTPWYMPMEQAKNAKDTDGRSDIYALGCTLYCFLTGAPPFAGKTLIEVIQAKEQGTFPPARRANPEVPERLDLVLAKMTAKLPQHRHQTCDELIKDLEGLRLAGDRLEFLTPKPPPAAAPPPSSSSAEIPAPAAAEKINPDVWYLRMKAPAGQPVLKRYRTAVVQKMLDDGTINPKVKASHSPTDGFRALATYKEFQGSAMAKASKEAADKQSSRYRDLYKKIHEKERRREAEEGTPRDTTPAWRSWVIALLPYACLVFAVGLLAWFLYWAGTSLGR